MTTETGRRPAPACSVVCFGEALWDVLPAGIFAGGAPLNVAYHLARHNLEARFVSAVGADFLGAELRRRIKAWQVDERFVATRPRRPTGTVQVAPDHRGGPAYRIARAVAWDHIATPPPLLRSPAPDAIVFGTLALRATGNRAALRRLLAAWPGALRVADLNLRPPFAGRAVVAWVLRHAQLLKLNADELSLLAGRPVRTPAAFEHAARRVAAAHGLTRLCVTAGGAGAGLLWDDRWHWQQAHPVAVRDTVGAGDAFLAAFLAAVLARRESPADALAQGCRMGEFVAARFGATPAYFCDASGCPHDRVS